MASRRRKKVRVREIGANDETEFIDRVRASRALHRPWTDLADSPARFGELLARAAAPTDAVFLIVRDADDVIVGVAHLSQIFLGNFRSAYLGFSAFIPFAGQGYMTEGLPLVLRDAFDRSGYIAWRRTSSRGMCVRSRSSSASASAARDIRRDT